MGYTTQQNIARRFGSPMRVTLSFAETKDQIDVEKVLRAFRQLMDEVLGRKATDAEVFGHVDICASQLRKEKTKNGLADINIAEEINSELVMNAT